MRPSATGSPSTTVGYTPQGCSALTFSIQPASKAALIATEFTLGEVGRHENLCERTAPMLLPPPHPLIAVTRTPLMMMLYSSLRTSN